MMEGVRVGFDQLELTINYGMIYLNPSTPIRWGYIRYPQVSSRKPVRFVVALYYLHTNLANITTLTFIFKSGLKVTVGVIVILIP